VCVLSAVPSPTRQVYEHGAHVTSWRDPGGDELLFVSKEARCALRRTPVPSDRGCVCAQAVFKPPKAIRGGVPVCWPQFSDFGTLGQHGFARNTVRSLTVFCRWAASLTSRLSPCRVQAWALLASGGASPHGAFVELGLSDSDETRASWPHSFALRLRLSLSDAGALRMDFDVDNTGAEALSFTFALHTYFRVRDAKQARVLGLSGTSYLDSLQARTRCTEAADAVVFDKEVDRIYLAVPDRLQLVDAAAARSFALETRGLPDAVVWNPWIAKAAAMADFGALFALAVHVAPHTRLPDARQTLQATRSTRKWCASRRQPWSMPFALRLAQPGRLDKRSTAAAFDFSAHTTAPRVLRVRKTSP